MEIKVLKNYSLHKKIGSGAFGDIFVAQHCGTKEKYAVKLEKINAPFPQLGFESKIYQFLQSDRQSHDRGIPKFIGFGTEGEYNIMVMELLGLSLEELFNRNKRKFSLKTVLQLADQMITRIEFMHSKHFIHSNKLLFIYDFGLSKRFIGKDGKHIPYRDNKSLTGTARYASINNHLGIEQSRRDDLESLGYVLIYFLKGSLPWQNLKADNKDDKYKKILQKKMSTPIEIVCKDIPIEFNKYLAYCKNLRFDSKPDYTYLRHLFKELMINSNFEFDSIYEWSSEEKVLMKKEVNKSVNSSSKRQSSNNFQALNIDDVILETKKGENNLMPQIYAKNRYSLNEDYQRKVNSATKPINQTNQSLFKTTAGTLLKTFQMKEYPQPKIVTCKK